MRFSSSPSGPGMARLVGLARAGAQVPSQLGPRPAPSRAGRLPAVTRHALPLVREASPSCFPSFITVLFVVQQIKFFWRRGREMREGKEGRERGRRNTNRAIRAKRLDELLSEQSSPVSQGGPWPGAHVHVLSDPLCLHSQPSTGAGAQTLQAARARRGAAPSQKWLTSAASLHRAHM